MKYILAFFTALLLAPLATLHGAERGSTKLKPPFQGTIFISAEIIKSSDPTAYSGLSEAGQGLRKMYDRRRNDWVRHKAFLFIAKYDDGLQIEVQVNPEFGSTENAQKVATKYAEVIGRLNHFLKERCGNSLDTQRSQAVWGR